MTYLLPDHGEFVVAASHQLDLSQQRVSAKKDSFDLQALLAVDLIFLTVSGDAGKYLKSSGVGAALHLSENHRKR